MVFTESLIKDIEHRVGETVTIFTTSGGESGSGFTGVLLGINSCFLRLITRIGPAPGCALGNDCDRHKKNCNSNGVGSDSFHRDNIGSVVDIPIDRIVAFVFNAV